MKHATLAGAGTQETNLFGHCSLIAKTDAPQPRRCTDNDHKHCQRLTAKTLSVRKVTVEKETKVSHNITDTAHCTETLIKQLVHTALLAE